MTTKTFLKKNWQAITAIVIVLLVVWYFGSRHSKNAPAAPASSAQGTSNETMAPAPTSKSSSTMTEGHYWEGMLQKSDNTSKGNLMLVMSDHTVYLRTSRDYSSLIGKKVEVSYQGDLNSFSLENIVAAE